MWKKNLADKFSNILTNLLIEIYHEKEYNNHIYSHWYLTKKDFLLLKDFFPRIGEFSFIHHPLISINQIEKLMSKNSYLCEQNLNLLTRTKQITPDFVFKHPETNWFYKDLKRSKNFTDEDLKLIFDESYELEKTFDEVTDEEFLKPEFQIYLKEYLFIYPDYFPSLSLDFILSHPEFKWSCLERSDVKLKHVLEYPNAKWHFFILTETIPYEDILSAPQLPWKYDYLGRNRSIQAEDFIKVCERHNVQLNHFIGHPNLTFKMIRDHPEIDWLKGYHSSFYEFRLDRFILRKFFTSELKIKNFASIEF